MPRMWKDRAWLAAALVIGWQSASLALGPYWISSPALVLTRLWALLGNGDLWFHARFTIGEALGGFLLGSIPGCLTAMLLRRHPFAEAAVESVAAIGYAVPKTALVPLFILWLGVGPAAKVALVASAIFFIVFYSTLRGIKAVDARLLLAARVLGATEWQLLRLVVWPAVVPYVFGGLRVAVPYAIAGAIVGEIISSNRGLGYLAQYGAMDFDTTLIFAALATVMAIVLVINAGVDRVQKRLLKWQSEQPQHAPRVTGA
jgi:NitT/TauT family transport system permease protein